MRRKVFRNPEPLSQEAVASLESLPLESFPLIEDFHIEVRTAGGRFGSHLHYVSHSRGDLVSFPWWDQVERDLRRMTLRAIPLGAKGEPFYELEQGWQLIIFRRGDYVYLLQGGEYGDRRAAFYTWFRVTRNAYLGEWDNLLRRHNPDYEPEI